MRLNSRNSSWAVNSSPGSSVAFYSNHDLISAIVAVSHCGFGYSSNALSFIIAPNVIRYGGLQPRHYFPETFCMVVVFPAQPYFLLLIESYLYNLTVYIDHNQYDNSIQTIFYL